MTSRVDIQETDSLLRETSRDATSGAFPVKQVLAELLGTALLANAVAMGTDALHIGLTLAALVFSLGHISGAQLNPAVTLAVFVRGKISAMKGIYYILAQLAGAFLGGLIAMPILEDAVEGSKISAPAIASGVGSMSAVSAEALYTMVLAFVVLTTATTKSQEGNSFFGLAIGAALTAGAKAVGAISGGALNPAIGIALPVLKNDGLGDVWVYIVGPLVGGLLAAGAFYLLEKPSELI
jgi:aquaporin Z